MVTKWRTLVVSSSGVSDLGLSSFHVASCGFELLDLHGIALIFCMSVYDALTSDGSSSSVTHPAVIVDVLENNMVAVREIQ